MNNLNKFEKSIMGISSLLMGLVLIRFSISKLAGWKISVDAFIEMAKPLGIDPTFFRISTGFLISTICISYLINAIITFFPQIVALSSKDKIYKFSLFANTLGLLTMLGALLSEFLLRVEPKWLLVYIATAIVLFSIVNLGIIMKNKINS
ncbi:hypothetical protein Fleli_0665 [Bernardetia litoralis DSM 6794]|uniref:Uncharacterized protein n=1 Tax=Bernardetia litoralis (strain ATCC 23117 / DSM 6794 / NBRC 15988 / NCIMB 1366 / Fx l1 / Sio-4) TaxID=880071 RepID=I4AGP3_BERLS|nr:hypothetical protein [Bernardetia litoralis]AFM03128.1 hypothetical protein Fleli_0665 [Bernardetia litoralis DSM 6794]